MKTKTEFFNELNAELSKLPFSEGNKVLEYYNELYFDKRENGENEASIIASFGEPADIVAKVQLTDEQNKITKADKTQPEKIKPEKVKTERTNIDRAQNIRVNKIGGLFSRLGESFKRSPVLFLIAAVFIGPFVIGFLAIMFGVAISFAAAAMSLLIAVWSVLLSLLVSGAAFVVAGIVGIFPSVYVMFTTFAVGVVQIGISLILIGLGALLVMGCLKVLKPVGNFTLYCLAGFFRWLSSLLFGSKYNTVRESV